MINKYIMPKAARKTVDLAGGPIKEGSDSVRIEGQPAARKGDAIQGHGDPPHTNPKIAKGSSKVRINGKEAARVGDPATCKHPITGGSSKVNIGG
jgi:uncharacterized Zn-binding protein involved in type VI secretion